VERVAERLRDAAQLAEPGESKPLPWPSTLRTSVYSHGDMCSSMSSACVTSL
jgi:hypothetical protein